MAAPPSYTQSQAHIQAPAQPHSRPKSGQMSAPFTLLPAYAAQGPETLVVKSQSSWSDGAYTVETIDGRPVFRTDKGDGFSLSYRRRVFDAARGTHLFTIKRETRTFQPTIYHAVGPSGTGAAARRLFECEFNPWSGGEECSGHFVNPTTGRQEHFLLKRSWASSRATLTNQASGQSVAEMKKESWHMRTEYHISVAPGGGMALAVALCIVLHDRQESHNSSSSTSSSS